jgi:hypothetical protein
VLGAAAPAWGAAADSPTLLNIGAGISQGAAQQLAGREEKFAQRQRAYQEFLDEVQRYNRDVRQKEAERDYERRLSAFEAEAKANRQAADAAATRRENEREHKRTMEEIKARGRQRRKTDRAQNELRRGSARAGEGTLEMDDFPIPESRAEIERQIGRVEARIDAMDQNRSDFTYSEYGMKKGGGFGRVTRTDEEFLEDLNRLQQYKSVLEGELQRNGGGDSRQGTSRSKRLGPGDVTTQPSVFNAPSGPSPPRQPSRQQRRNAEATRPEAQGGASEQGGSTQSGSMQGGSFAEYDQVAQQQGPRAAIDSIEQAWRDGILSAQEAKQIARQLQSKYGQ